ncbi:hypothetical protein HpBT074_01960 [Helicobacter pylori]
MISQENTMISQENTMISQENTMISQENTMISQENTIDLTGKYESLLAKEANIKETFWERRADSEKEAFF